MVAGMNRERRVIALEQAKSSSVRQLHCIRRYEGESEADAVAAYEADSGPISDDRNIVRVLINKPSARS